MKRILFVVLLSIPLVVIGGGPRNELRQRLLNIYSLSENWTPAQIEAAVYSLNARVLSEQV